jgi:hypothetical protein
MLFLKIIEVIIVIWAAKIVNMIDLAAALLR